MKRRKAIAEKIVELDDELVLLWKYRKYVNSDDFLLAAPDRDFQKRKSMAAEITAMFTRRIAVVEHKRRLLQELLSMPELDMTPEELGEYEEKAERCLKHANCLKEASKDFEEQSITEGYGRAVQEYIDYYFKLQYIRYVDMGCLDMV